MPAVPEGLVVLLQVTDATMFGLHLGGGGSESGHLIGGRGGEAAAFRDASTAARIRASGARHALGAQVFLALAFGGRRRCDRGRCDDGCGRLGPGRCGRRLIGRERGRRAVGRFPDGQRAHAAGQRTVVVVAATAAAAAAAQRGPRLVVVLFFLDVVQLFGVRRPGRRRGWRGRRLRRLRRLLLSGDGRRRCRRLRRFRNRRPGFSVGDRGGRRR